MRIDWVATPARRARPPGARVIVEETGGWLAGRRLVRGSGWLDPAAFRLRRPARRVRRLARRPRVVVTWTAGRPARPRATLLFSTVHGLPAVPARGDSRFTPASSPGATGILVRRGPGRREVHDGQPRWSSAACAAISDDVAVLTRQARGLGRLSRARGRPVDTRGPAALGIPAGHDPAVAAIAAARRRRLRATRGPGGRHPRRRASTAPAPPLPLAGIFLLPPRADAAASRGHRRPRRPRPCRSWPGQLLTPAWLAPTVDAAAVRDVGRSGSRRARSDVDRPDGWRRCRRSPRLVDEMERLARLTDDARRLLAHALPALPAPWDTPANRAHLEQLARRMAPIPRDRPGEPDRQIPRPGSISSSASAGRRRTRAAAGLPPGNPSCGDGRRRRLGAPRPVLHGLGRPTTVLHQGIAEVFLEYDLDTAPQPDLTPSLFFAVAGRERASGRRAGARAPAARTVAARPRREPRALLRRVPHGRARRLHRRDAGRTQACASTSSGFGWTSLSRSSAPRAGGSPAGRRTVGCLGVRPGGPDHGVSRRRQRWLPVAGTGGMLAPSRRRDPRWEAILEELWHATAAHLSARRGTSACPACCARPKRRGRGPRRGSRRR